MKKIKSPLQQLILCLQGGGGSLLSQKKLFHNTQAITEEILSPGFKSLEAWKYMITKNFFLNFHEDGSVLIGEKSGKYLVLSHLALHRSKPVKSRGVVTRP